MRVAVRGLWGIVAVWCLGGGPARAEVVLGTFTGVWDTVYGPPLGIAVGDTFSGTFSYDTSAADFDPHPASGAFFTPMTVSLASRSLAYSGSWQAPLDYGEYLHIVNNYVEVGNYDSFEYQFRTTDNSGLQGAPAGIYGINFLISLFDSSGTAFSSTTPPGNMSLSAFNPANRRAGIWGGGPDWWGLYGNLTSLTAPYTPPPPPPVPEPTSVAIWTLAGLAAWTAQRWGRRGR